MVPWKLSLTGYAECGVLTEYAKHVVLTGTLSVVYLVC